jgi:hypothetical protein
VKQSSNFNVEHLKNFSQTATDYFSIKSQLKQLSSETNQLINICSTGTSKRSSSLQKRPEIFEYNIISSSVKIIKKTRQRLQQWIKYSLIEEKNNPFQVKILIFTAIDYLLGKKNSNLQPKLKQSIKATKSNFLFSNLGSHKSKLINKNVDDLWLSWDDRNEEKTNLYKSLKEDAKVLFKHQSKRRENKKNKLKPIATSVYEMKPKHDFIERIKSPYTALKEVKPQDNLSENLPNWIETEAKSTGYVKHPLENILGWLDMIISWLERLGSKLWEALRKLTK